MNTQKKRETYLKVSLRAIHGVRESASQGVITSSTADPLDKTFFQDTSSLKAALVFFDLENPIGDINFIISPSLESMLSNPSLKKDLWSKLKPLQSS